MVKYLNIIQIISSCKLLHFGWNFHTSILLCRLFFHTKTWIRIWWTHRTILKIAFPKLLRFRMNVFLIFLIPKHEKRQKAYSKPTPISYRRTTSLLYQITFSSTPCSHRVTVLRISSGQTSSGLFRRNNSTTSSTCNPVRHSLHSYFIGSNIWK